MRIVFLVSMAILIWSKGVAQKNSFEIHTPEDLHNLPANFRFLYPEFRRGYLEFVMNKRSQLLELNYDLLNNQLLFITEKRDTMWMKEVAPVKYLRIKDDQYVFDIKKGFLKILLSDSLYLLTSYESLNRQPIKKIQEGYGGSTNGTSASVAVSKNDQFILERHVSFHLIDRNGRITNADRFGFLKTFKKKSQAVKDYIKLNHIEFSNQADITRLFQFCVTPSAVSN